MLELPRTAKYSQYRTMPYYTLELIFTLISLISKKQKISVSIKSGYSRKNTPLKVRKDFSAHSYSTVVLTGVGKTFQKQYHNQYISTLSNIYYPVQKIILQLGFRPKHCDTRQPTLGGQ